jgi:hypothetical protein
MMLTPTDRQTTSICVIEVHRHAWHAARLARAGLADKRVWVPHMWLMMPASI